MLGLDIRLILAYIINVAILFVFLRLVLYKPVRKFMKEREMRFASQREDIEAERAKAEELKAQYEGQLSKAQEAGDAIIRESRTQANQRAETILNDARSQAVDIVDRSRREIAEERRVARQSMKDEIATLAVDISSKVLERQVSAEDTKNIVDKFLSKERIG
ncbi:MAG: F0F1 ATP synthase subunit B [Eubacteriales bacterium]|nr:F0F1 ATP synthase subunit B [Eubacteriales bacterium]